MPLYDYTTTYTTSFIDSLDLFVSEVLLFIPKLIFAYLLWIVGKWLINLAISAIARLDIKRWQFDDRLRSAFLRLFIPTSKVILFLVILDTFGIGSSIIQALFGAIALSIAIALGLAFGRALEPEANKLVDVARTNLRNSNRRTV